MELKFIIYQSSLKLDIAKPKLNAGKKILKAAGKKYNTGQINR